MTDHSPQCEHCFAVPIPPLLTKQTVKRKFFSLEQIVDGI
jgi:hypothetical protein